MKFNAKTEPAKTILQRAWKIVTNLVRKIRGQVKEKQTFEPVFEEPVCKFEESTAYESNYIYPW